MTQIKNPLILEIKGNSLDDGPGIRSMVFYKGCPLSCVWCHNPESKKATVEISFDAKICIDCGSCRDVCLKTLFPAIIAFTLTEANVIFVSCVLIPAPRERWTESGHQCRLTKSLKRFYRTNHFSIRRAAVLLCPEESPLYTWIHLPTFKVAQTTQRSHASGNLWIFST